MSREVLREVVSALTRFHRETARMDRIEEWATRLEQHLAELEMLAALDLPPSLAPDFVPDGDVPAPMPPPGPEEGSLEAAPADAAPAPEAPEPEYVRPSLALACRQVRRGERSPEQLVLEAVDRMQRLSHIHAFIAEFREQAATAARECRAAGRGPVRLLEGVPVAVKDLIAMRGYTMTGGSRVLGGEPQAEDAPAVARLRQAGAIIVGAANLHELAYGVTSENPHFGSVLNPRNPEHMAGGSSGGSAAAVAAGMALGGVGTDTGGSVRIPASACGVAGLKPTYGRISCRGVFPLSWSLDHVGVLAPRVADTAMMLAAMADRPGPEERALAEALADPASRALAGTDLPDSLQATAALARSLDGDSEGGLASGDFEASILSAVSGLRLGWVVPEWTAPLEPAVEAAAGRVRKEMEEAGLRLVPVAPAPIPHIRVAQFAILQAEAAAVHRARLASDYERFGRDVQVRLKVGEFLTAVDYIQGQRLRRQVVHQFARLFQQHVDVLLLPALPIAAPRLGTRRVQVAGRLEPVHRALTRFTAAFNLTGLPALVVNVGTAPGHLPVGLQLVASRGRELDLVRVGVALEALLTGGVHTAR